LDGRLVALGDGGEGEMRLACFGYVDDSVGGGMLVGMCGKAEKSVKDILEYEWEF
jgi:hypothetical protein